MILDRSALSALADGEPQLQPVIAAAATLAIPVIALGEYRYGIRQSRERPHYERWLAELLAVSVVLNIDDGTAAQYAVIRSELKSLARPIPANDVWIAALCRQHALPVLSKDLHFDSVPELRRVSW